ncbi:malate transporter [Salmonella enterica subsp. enterica]|uniref:Malate transporter n=1 Tax=Salmonella enterica I TaxID=59201 RepID=A0A3S4HWN0_SALET|nr:malate transporter [Salmonella enterica subsp. enterica]
MMYCSNHYQACLDDYTRPAILHGQCQPEIIRWHTLTMVICTLPCSELAELLLPEGLQRVLNIPTNSTNNSGAGHQQKT